MGFFILFFLALFAIYFYAGVRLIPLMVSPGLRRFLWGLLGVCLALPFVHFALRLRHASPTLSDLTGLAGYSAMGFFTLLACGTLVRDAGLVMYRIYRKMIDSRRTAEQPVDPVRRGIVKKASGLVVTAVTISASAGGFVLARRAPRVVEQDLVVKGLHPDLAGLCILQFTDLHAGPTIKKEFVRRAVDRIQQTKKDLIVCTGDLVDGSVETLKDDVAPLRQLTAPLGKYFVTGNHEYYSGVGPWLAQIKTLGFDVLNNDHRLIRRGRGKITLAGVPDYSTRYFGIHEKSSPVKAAGGCEPESLKILLAHQPKSVFEAAKAGFHIQISGHTHGGQYFPGNLAARITQPFIQGFYRYRGVQLYVSPGTGYWGPPLRLGTVQEITRFTLRAA